MGKSKSPMMTIRLLVVALLTNSSVAFTSRIRTTPEHGLALFAKHDRPSRRAIIGTIAAAGAGLLSPTQDASAVERAIGAAEAKCREQGNCLETFDLDGAVGWNWGAAVRCDSTDPRCGSDGVLQDAPPAGEAVPKVTSKVTHEVTLQIAVGKGEMGTLRLGLYGEATPKSVQELVDFLTPNGLVTGSRLMFEDGYGVTSAPVSMAKGGILAGISPGQKLVFGLPSQSAAYARSIGTSTAGDNFTPQPRPKEKLTGEASARSHDSAGLLSIPGAGLGYADNASEDEAFANAFQITASAVPSMDKEGRKVVGQVLDAESMEFLARLSKLPTNKGLKGIIPGQNFGPPLLKCPIKKVRVDDLVAKAPEPEETK